MSGGTVFWDASRIAFDQRPGVGAPERDGPAIFWIAARASCRIFLSAHVSRRSKGIQRILFGPETWMA